MAPCTVVFKVDETQQAKFEGGCLRGMMACLPILGGGEQDLLVDLPFQVRPQALRPELGLLSFWAKHLTEA